MAALLLAASMARWRLCRRRRHVARTATCLLDSPGYGGAVWWAAWGSASAVIHIALILILWWAAIGIGAAVCGQRKFTADSQCSPGRPVGSSTRYPHIAGLPVPPPPPPPPCYFLCKQSVPRVFLLGLPHLETLQLCNIYSARILSVKKNSAARTDWCLLLNSIGAVQATQTKTTPSQRSTAPPLASVPDCLLLSSVDLCPSSISCFHPFTHSAHAVMSAIGFFRRIMAVFACAVREFDRMFCLVLFKQHHVIVSIDTRWFFVSVQHVLNHWLNLSALEAKACWCV